MRSIRSILKKRLIGGVPVHLDRQGAFHMAWGHIYNNHMRGDYVEFGVYRGDSLQLSYLEFQKFVRWNSSQLTSDEGWRRKLSKEYSDYLPTFFGFDTFIGMPENSEGANEYASGTFETSIKDVEKKLLANIPSRQLKLIVGDFTSLDGELAHLDKPIAIVNIDSDLYESAKSALVIVQERLQVGSVILFDEFHAFNADPSKGERRALTEWLEGNSVQVERWFDYHYGGRAFLVTGL